MVVQPVLYCQFSAKISEKYQRAEKPSDYHATYIVRTNLCYMKSWKFWLRFKMIYVCQCCRPICMKSSSFYHRDQFKIKGIRKYGNAVEKLYTVKWTSCRLNRIYYKIGEYLKANCYIKIPLILTMSVYTWRMFQC